VATEITLPRLGQGMESGTIVRWLKAEGDAVDRDEPIYEVDTEKVTQEVESPVAGVLLKILVAEGAEVPVGEPLCFIGEAGEVLPAMPEAPNGHVETAAEPSSPDAPAEADAGLVASAEAPAPAAAAELERARGQEEAARAAEAPAAEPAAATSAASGEGRVKASPLARRMARERGIELGSVRGTGPDGRIVAEDLERLAAAVVAKESAAAPATPPAAAAEPAEAAEPEFETVKLTGMRRTIARRLVEAWEAPHFSISLGADMRQLIELREALVERAPEGGPKPTYSDVITKLCAVALLDHPTVNANYVDGEIHIFRTANIGMAVAVPNGLVVPVLRTVEVKTVPQLAAERVEIVGRTRENKLVPEDFVGGTFTISNLGMFGIERFVAVINPPQVAILAVGGIEERVVAEKGQPVVRPRMDLTLSCDHRALDGATAAQFLRDLKGLLEEPGLAL
jgi:pyruvate dehydrogenase E2 component (dihydrolipoyllysine-residue acetyltransferase)